MPSSELYMSNRRVTCTMSKIPGYFIELIYGASTDYKKLMKYFKLEFCKRNEEKGYKKFFDINGNVVEDEEVVAVKMNEYLEFKTKQRSYKPEGWMDPDDAEDNYERE